MLLLTGRIYLTDGGELEGPKHEFYYLWDQNENWKLFEGPNDLLSLLKRMYKGKSEKNILNTIV